MEYHAVNRLRLLVNELRDIGVTAENFHAWNTLQAAVPASLVLDVQNMLLSLQKGIDIPAHALKQVSPGRINAEVKRTIEQHRARFWALPSREAVCETDSPVFQS